MPTNSQSPPLKTDVIGRVQVSAKHREALLDAYEASSMSGAKFAAVHGVKYLTFASSVDTIGAKDGEPSGVAALRIQHPSGISMSVEEEQQAQLAVLS